MRREAGRQGVFDLGERNQPHSVLKGGQLRLLVVKASYPNNIAISLHKGFEILVREFDRYKGRHVAVGADLSSWGEVSPVNVKARGGCDHRCNFGAVGDFYASGIRVSTNDIIGRLGRQEEVLRLG